MPIRQWTGLGSINNPYDTTGLSSLAVYVNKGKVNKIIVDHIGSSSQSPGNVSRLTNLTPSPVVMSNNPASFLGSDGKNHPLLVPDTTPLLLSQETGPAPTETIFRDLRLELRIFYNFWTEDELTNDRDAVGKRQLADVPRFIKLNWNPAPDLPGERLQIKRVSTQAEKKKTTTNNTIVKYHAEGIDLTPLHLLPEGFAVAANSPANGYLSPGVIESVMEFHQESTEDLLNTILSPADYIDEDQFLDHPDTEGLILNELKLNLLQINDPLFKTLDLQLQNIDPLQSDARAKYFTGKYFLKKPLNTDGSFELQGIKTQEQISLHTIAPINTKNDPITDFAGKMSEPIGNQNHTPIYSKVKLVDSGVSNAVSPTQINSMRKPEHAETMIKMATMLPPLQFVSALGFHDTDEDLEQVLSRIPTFPSPPGLKPLEYVGYIIQKSILRNGNFEIVDTIHIPSRDTTEFYDSKVLYGQTYRYQIKAILRWTRLKEEPNTVFSSARKVCPFISAYLHGEWDAPYGYGTILDTIPPDPPDELTVRPESAKKRIIVTIKFPDNPQKDIRNLVIARRLQDNRGYLTDWEVIAADLPPRNNLYIDEDVDFTEDNGITYIYAAQTISKHQEKSDLSEQYSAQLNKNWHLQGEHPVKFVSNKGVKILLFGQWSTSPATKIPWQTVIKSQDTSENDSVGNSFGFYLTARERFNNNLSGDRDYTIRVESLDTGEIVEEKISFRVNNIKEKYREQAKAENLAIKRPLFDPLYRSKFGRLL